MSITLTHPAYSVFYMNFIAPCMTAAGSHILSKDT